MTVADLQQLLAELTRFLRAAGSKANMLTELEGLRDGLSPFSNLTLKAMIARLSRPDAAPLGGTGPTRGGGGRTARVKSDPEALARDVKELYERAASPDVSHADLDAQVDRLEPLIVKDLLAIAEQIDLFDLKAKKKKKPEILEAIRRRLHDRKGGSERAAIVDRPAAAPVAPSHNNVPVG